MVFIIVRVKIQHDVSRSVSHLVTLEIEFYLIYLSLLVRVGIDKGISSPHEQLDLFQFGLINKQGAAHKLQVLER
jgi:hypothetical protein